MQPTTVSHHPTNAALVEELIHFYVDQRFGPKTAAAIDTTYGQGGWWTTGGRERLGDLHVHSGDMRDTGLADASVDVVFYDPPYVSVGGRTTTQIQEFFDAYGLGDAPKTPHQLQILMNEGLDEACRILRPKGFVFMKCTNYVSSGKLWTGVTKSIDHALTIPKMRVFDLIVHETGTGPQPETDKCRRCDGRGRETSDVLCSRCGGEGRLPRRKVHARNNASVMLILEKGGRR